MKTGRKDINPSASGWPQPLSFPQAFPDSVEGSFCPWMSPRNNCFCFRQGCSWNRSLQQHTFFYHCFPYSELVFAVHVGVGARPFGASAAGRWWMCVGESLGKRIVLGGVGKSKENCQSGFIFFLLLFWPGCVACGILVPRVGIEPMFPAVEMWSPNHWTAREVPGSIFYVWIFYGIRAPWTEQWGWIPFHYQ